MNDVRFLTMEEATVLSHAAERWLRLGDVELNPGEQVLGLLTRAAVRPQDCKREDIAGINRTLMLQLPDCEEPKELTLVSPEEADASLNRVSVLTSLGLSFVGRVVGSIAQLQLAAGPSMTARLLAVRRCASLEGGDAAGLPGDAGMLAL